MNVAVKTLNQSILTAHDWPTIVLDRKQWMVVIMSAMILISAFFVVCIKDTNRQLMSELQTLENTQENLHNAWSQLLLEESTWASQARIGEVAVQNLDMVQPKTKSIIVIQD
ncbi:MAG TPA: cell division protein FtsL [Coxiellaceae bacterium]|nr:cell division protein FtsL [Coxiellaceae bacterium]